jgi:hypothetical protein
MRRIIIGASRDIEYDLRNDFFAHCSGSTSRISSITAPATSCPRDQRSQRRPHDDRASRDVHGRDGADVRGRDRADALDRRRLTLLALIPLPFVSLFVWYSAT